MSGFNIKNITPNIKLPAVETQQAGSITDDFSKLLNNSIDQVSQQQKVAETSIHDFSADGTESVHNVMINMEKASIKFELMAETRNKIIEAYQEVMRMQV